MSNKSLIFVAVSASMLLGCASHKVAEVPSLSYNVPEIQQEVVADGVTLRVNPIHDPEQLERYFGQDLIKYGILPLQVSVHNTGYSNSLLFSKDGVHLFDALGEKKMMLSVHEIMKEAKKSYWRTAGWTVAFGVFGAIPSAINVTNTNNKMENDFNEKIVDDGPLNPGSIREGMVFFAVPKKLETLDGWKVSLMLKDPNGVQDVVAEHELAGTVLARKQEEENTPTQE